MAGGCSNVKEEIEMTTLEDLRTGSVKKSQEQLVAQEMMERGSESLGGVQRRPRMETKPAGAGPFWNVTGPRPKKGGHQLQMPRMPREQSQGDIHLHEFTGSFQGERLPCKHLEADIMAEIDLEELNGLEMEIMRRQMQMLSGRLRTLEEQSAAWRHHKEAILFTLLLFVCVANLWLWIRQ